MAYRLSPNVSVTETDQTGVIASITLGSSATVGNFHYGPVEQIVTVDNEDQLRSVFGRPTNTIYEDYFNAYNYLTYAQGLRLVRVVGTDARNAIVGGYTGDPTPPDVVIKNNDAWEASAQNQSPFLARYPGTFGNSLEIQVANATEYANDWPYAYLFSGPPGTDQIHVVVIDSLGNFTGNSGTILELYPFASTVEGTKSLDGAVNYYKTWINRNSRFIYAGSDMPANTFEFDLAGGVDGAPATGDIQTGYDLFKNPDEVNVTSIFVGGQVAAVVKYVIDNIALDRRDLVVFCAPQLVDVLNTSTAASNVAAFKTALGSNSYFMMSDNWKYIYDKYNEVYRWISTASDLAGLSARVDADSDPWFPFAGYTRGKIRNAVKLAWTPTPTEADDLFRVGVNGIRREPGQGFVLMGDKTGLIQPSAFGEIGVRKLFNHIEKNVAEAAKYILFELNDEVTRSMFISMVTPFMEDIQFRRGFRRFEIRADSSINTEQVIANNEFRAQIRILPTRSIRYVVLNFTAVNGEIEFEEITE